MNHPMRRALMIVHSWNGAAWDEQRARYKKWWREDTGTLNSSYDASINARVMRATAFVWAHANDRYPQPFWPTFHHEATSGTLVDILFPPRWQLPVLHVFDPESTLDFEARHKRHVIEYEKEELRNQRTREEAAEQKEYFAAYQLAYAAQEKRIAAAAAAEETGAV